MTDEHLDDLKHTLLSTVALDAAVSLLGDSYQWRLVAAAIAIGLVVATSVWVGHHTRRPEPGATNGARLLQHVACLTPWAMLAGALGATLLAVLGRDEAALWAALLTAGALIVPADPPATRERRLGGTGMIAFGMAVAGIGVTRPAAAVVGLAAIALGSAVLAGHLNAAATVAGGLAIAGAGTAMLSDNAIGLLAGTVAAGGYGIAHLAERNHWCGIASIAAGLVLAVCCAGDPSQIGIAVAGAGLAAYGVVLLVDRHGAIQVTMMVLGLVGGLCGLHWVTEGKLVGGAAVALLSIACAALGGYPMVQQAQSWWRRVAVTSPRTGAA